MKPEQLLSSIKDKVWNTTSPRIANRRLFLTYVGVIPPDIIQNKMNSLIGGSAEIHCGVCVVDGENVTQVAVDFVKQLHSEQSNCRSLFDITVGTRVFTPRIRTILSGKQWENALTYIDTYCSNCAIQPETWYDDVLEIMDCGDRSEVIYWFYNEGDRCNINRATDYIRTLEYEYWIIIQNIKNATQLRRDIASKMIEKPHVDGLLICIDELTDDIHNVIRLLKRSTSNIELNPHCSFKVDVDNIVILSHQWPGSSNLYDVRKVVDRGVEGKIITPYSSKDTKRGEPNPAINVATVKDQIGSSNTIININIG